MFNCRFHWLSVKLLEESTECLAHSSVNPFIFKPLPNYHMNKDDLRSIFVDPNFAVFDTALDGILFYHKKLNYMPGHTPLVGWLKGYMIPEILDIPISNAMECQKPAGYANMGLHISQFETNYKQEKEKRKTNEIQRNADNSSELIVDICSDKMDVKH